MDDKNNNNPWFLICVLFTCFSLNSYVSVVGFGTISSNQSLSGDQTISSEHGIFILGFFNPPGSSKYYIGIWYNSVSQAAVWVANREKPVSDKYSSSFQISNGNLVLLNEQGVLVWSTNSSSTSNVEAVLLDDGNLILTDGAFPTWQSFDHPTDTFLPGNSLGFNKITKKAKYLTSWKSQEDPAPGLYSLEQYPSGTSQFCILLNRSQIIWCSGDWNGTIFKLVPEMRLNYIYNFSYINNENESIITYSLYDNSLISRLLIDVGGQIQQMSWLDSSKDCPYCGDFGTCVGQAPPFCECLSGFRPRSVNEWNSQIYADGCVRKTSLQCSNSSQINGKSDGFLEIRNLELPKDPLRLPSTNFQECESTCLKDCSCTAFATYENGSCSIWHGGLVSIRQLPDDAKGDTLYIRLAASEFSSSKNNKSTFIGAVAGSVAMLLLLTLVLCGILRRKRRRTKDKVLGRTSVINYSSVAGEGQNNTKLVLFSFKSILAATNNFSEANKLGEGGFGPVYKGILPGNLQVAIKRLSRKSGQGTEEFMNELKLIANLQHKYLVRLLGS